MLRSKERRPEPDTVFVPEAQRKLAGGTTTGNRAAELPSPGRGDRPSLVCRPYRGWVVCGTCLRGLHPRLISAAPPAQRGCQVQRPIFYCVTSVRRNP